jgi:CheY-like chemotaxis protein
MVRGFTEQSGGGLLITSVPGHGTTIHIWLPQAIAPHAPMHQEGPTISGAAARSGVVARRVLLVDDDELVLQMTAEWLEYSGYIVRTATNGTDALALLDEGAPVDVLVTDLSMPGISGIVTIREAHQRRPGLPAMLLTGHAEDSAAAAETAGSFVLLRKPIRGAMLIEEIEAAITKQEAA